MYLEVQKNDSNQRTKLFVDLGVSDVIGAAAAAVVAY